MTARPLPVPTTAADVSLLLHEAVVVGHYGDALVVQRRRPHIPCGEDPRDVNRECARTYVVYGGVSGNWGVLEVDPSDVKPFVDVEQLKREADERANAAQATNKRKAT